MGEMIKDVDLALLQRHCILSGWQGLGRTSLSYLSTVPPNMQLLRRASVCVSSWRLKHRARRPPCARIERKGPLIARKHSNTNATGWTMLDQVLHLVVPCGEHVWREDRNTLRCHSQYSVVVGRCHDSRIVHKDAASSLTSSNQKRGDTRGVLPVNGSPPSVSATSVVGVSRRWRQIEQQSWVRD